MLNGTIIEVAVLNSEAYPYPWNQMVVTPPNTNHYWRVRWIEDGAESDQVCQIDDLATMARFARDEGKPVAWRYYVTGVE